MATSSRSSAEPIAVLAGTPVDTQMGADLLTANGLRAISFPLASDPLAQTAFQLSSQREKRDAVLSVLHSARDRGCGRVLVYCNSLSSSVDFDALAEETGLRIVTPLQVYRSLPARYRRLGLIAANAQGLAGIERTLYQADPSMELLGVSLLPVVLSIEAGLPPKELVAQHRLAELAEWFRSRGMEALVLGCTHFPYFKEALAARASLPLLDPADELLRLLTE